MLKAVIIDDSKDAIENLRLDLAPFASSIQVVGIADGVVSGAKLLRETPSRQPSSSRLIRCTASTALHGRLP